MNATEYQRLTGAALRRYFPEVQLEWSVSREATDALASDITRYAPRVDIAVGPYNVSLGSDSFICETPLPGSLQELFSDLPPNRNPRCLLAIEVIFSGTSKHIMGDMLNAAALGCYGLVIGQESQMNKIRRIQSYLIKLYDLGKQPQLFSNVIALSTAEFDARLASG
jgi:hypothetical protein